MKKLFTPILVLTLIVGFSALALGGTTEASADQTLTANVQSAFSVDAPGTVTLTVGPNTTDSVTKTDGLGYSFNDTTANSITVDVSGSFHTMTLTVSAANVGSSGGSGHSSTISSSTTGATLIDGGLNTEGDYSADVTFEGSDVDWDEPAVQDSNALTLVYKMVGSSP